MKMSLRYLPVLITLALLCLIGLQILWLVFVHKYKTQELKDKTREAVLATSERLQREEDAHLIINEMDSLFLGDSVVDIHKEKEVRVLVSNTKEDIKVDELKHDTSIHQQMKVIRDSSLTTFVKLSGGKEQSVIVQSRSLKQGSVKKKAKELQSLFWHMAISSRNTKKDIETRIDSHNIQSILRSELLSRGIDLHPELEVRYSPKQDKPESMGHYPVFNTPGYSKTLPVMVSLALFPNDVFGSDLFINVAYGPSKNNFVFKQMAGLLALSFSITLLIGFVMIYIFRRLLSQEKLQRIKNDFVNNMTHELKTPIATTRLALEAISHPQIKDSEERFSEYVRILKEENLKLNTHVERVLQMALLEKGELQLKKESVDLGLLIKTSINTYALQIAEQKAELIFATPPAPIMLYGDREHLQSVFNNLLDNALKYSSQPCKIEIALSENEERIKIVFKDNGIGIAPEYRDRIFEKFYRAQGGNLHDVKGFGLGLSYVKSIVEAHGGSLKVSSEPGLGTDFTILFNHIGT